MTDPGALADMAAKARAEGRVDSGAALADFAERIAPRSGEAGG